MLENQEMQKIQKIQIHPNSNLFPVLPAVMVSVKGVTPPFDKDNIITIARVTSLTSTPPCVCISIKESRFSYEQVMESGEFVINFIDSKLLYAADWCGVKSGKDYNKFEICNLTPVSMENMKIAPAILEAKLSLGCKLVQSINMAQYGILIGEVVSVIADKDVVDQKGKVISENMDSIVFDSVNAYYRHTGDNLKKYGYSIGENKRI